MRRREQTKNQRKSENLGELEKVIREKLEQTGLVMHIRFHYGNLEDNKRLYINSEEENDSDFPEQIEPSKATNPSYMEFKRNENQRASYENCKLLRTNIFDIITHSISGTIGISYKQPYKEVYRAYPILYPEFEIENQKDFHIEMLIALNKLLEAYLSRNSLRRAR